METYDNLVLLHQNSLSMFVSKGHANNLQRYPVKLNPRANVLCVFPAYLLSTANRIESQHFSTMDLKIVLHQRPNFIYTVLNIFLHSRVI